MADFNSKKSYFDILQDYIQSGSKESLTDDEQSYLNLLSLINSLRRKYGKENTIAFIQRPPNNIPYRKAREMYDEAINLFYSDDAIDNQAHRNSMYEEMMLACKLILRTAKNPTEMEIYFKGMKDAYMVKGLDKPEAQKVPEGMYKKPLKIYSLNPGAIGLKSENRNSLAERIDGLEIAEVEKNRIRQEAGVSKVDFLDMYDEQEAKVGSTER